MKFFALVFCAIALGVAVEGAVRYDGYKVYRIHFTTEEQFQTLYKLDVNDDPATGVMFWQLSHLEHWADVMLSPKAAGPFLAKLDSEGFTYELVNDNVQRSMDAERTA